MKTRFTKKLFALFTALTLCFSMAIPAFAQSSVKLNYGTVKNQINVMITGVTPVKDTKSIDINIKTDGKNIAKVMSSAEYSIDNVTYSGAAVTKGSSVSMQFDDIKENKVLNTINVYLDGVTNTKCNVEVVCKDADNQKLETATASISPVFTNSKPNELPDNANEVETTKKSDTILNNPNIKQPESTTETSTQSKAHTNAVAETPDIAASTNAQEENNNVTENSTLDNDLALPQDDAGKDGLKDDANDKTKNNENTSGANWKIIWIVIGSITFLSLIVLTVIVALLRAKKKKNQLQNPIEDDCFEDAEDAEDMEGAEDMEDAESSEMKKTTSSLEDKINTNLK